MAFICTQYSLRKKNKSYSTTNNFGVVYDDKKFRSQNQFSTSLRLEYVPHEHVLEIKKHSIAFIKNYIKNTHFQFVRVNLWTKNR